MDVQTRRDISRTVCQTEFCLQLWQVTFTTKPLNVDRCANTGYVHYYLHVHSRSISFLSWCLSQFRVGDSGQPLIVWRQHQHTEESRVNDWRSARRDLSVAYISKYVRISNISSISNGRSRSFYSKTPQYQLIFHAVQTHWWKVKRTFPKSSILLNGMKNGLGATFVLLVTTRLCWTKKMG